MGRVNGPSELLELFARDQFDRHRLLLPVAQDRELDRLAGAGVEFEVRKEFALGVHVLTADREEIASHTATIVGSLENARYAMEFLWHAESDGE